MRKIQSSILEHLLKRPLIEIVVQFPTNYIKIN